MERDKSTQTASRPSRHDKSADESNYDVNGEQPSIHARPDSAAVKLYVCMYVCVLCSAVDMEEVCRSASRCR